MTRTPPHRADHVLTYAQNLRGGGVERAQLRLARGWLEAGRRVTLAIGTAKGALSHELPDGLEIVAIGGESLTALRVLPSLVRAHRPDILFCPGNHYTGVAGWARLRLGKDCPPIVGKVSNALERPDHRSPMAFAYRWWLRRHPWFLDHIVAMSPAMAREAEQIMRLAPDRIGVIPNPPPHPIPGAPLPALPAGRFLLGVGRLERQKRWDRLIAALPHIADQDVSLVILGEGRLRTTLEAQIASLGLGGRVTMPGHVADPFPVIARAATVVLVSDFEGVPGVLREALSLGTPVVTTDSSVAVREIVGGPHHGTIVRAGDEQALVAALDHWLEPARVRPDPVPSPGVDSAERYLEVFDRLVAERRA